MVRGTMGVLLVWLGVVAVPVPAPGAPALDTDLRDALVKIYTVQSRPDYQTPWERYRHQSYSGSGVIIDGNRILTNAHVVSDNTFIEARRNGEAEKHTARVLAVSHTADLALLTVDDPDFFRGVTPLSLGGLPLAQQEVVVYGFPTGGDSLSVTKGIISRIEHQFYTHSTAYLLAGQFDAAVNPGSSGGPVIRDGRVVGVVMQGRQDAENTGYMVPIPIIRHFLEDIADGAYDGFPDDGMLVQEMENAGMRERYGLGPGETGVLVTDVVPGSPAEGTILPGDVLRAVEGHEIANDGTVEFRPGERTSADHYTKLHQIGEKLTLRLLRGGEERSVSFVLHAMPRPTLVPNEQYDVLPRYYIYGGLVFSPLTKNYLLSWGNDWYKDTPDSLMNYYYNGRQEVAGEEVVILIKILPSEVNKGYSDLEDYAITHVGGKRIRSLDDLIRGIEASAAEPTVRLTAEGRNQIVLDRGRVADESARILETYGVPAASYVERVSAGRETSEPGNEGPRRGGGTVFPARNRE